MDDTMYFETQRSIAEVDEKIAALLASRGAVQPDAGLTSQRESKRAAEQ
jgi:hypothetical protein